MKPSFNRSALFLFQGPQFPTGDFLTGRQQIFEKLAAMGIDVRLALLSNNPFNKSGITTRRLISENTMTDVDEPLAYNRIGTVINRTGRRLPEDVATTFAKNGTTVINDDSLRLLLRNKYHVQKDILEPLGFGIPTEVISSSHDAASFISRNPAREYVIKPNNGARGMYQGKIKRLNASESVTYAGSAHEEQVTDIIIQPAYTFTSMFPSSVRPYDKKSDEKFYEGNKEGLVKEIRAYVFMAGGHVETFPVGRLLTDKSYWFFIDPASIPLEVYDAAASIAKKTASVAGSSAAFMSIDFGYGNLDQEPRKYHVIEVNGQGPYLIAYDLSFEIADMLRDCFTRMIEKSLREQDGILQ